MSKEEKALALALDTAFARDCDLEQGDSDGVKSSSTPRLRLEAAQLLADKVGPEPQSPSEANLMDEIFKGGSSSFNYGSSDVDNKQALDEMDKILENLKSRRSARQQDDKESDDYEYDLRDSDHEEDDEEFRAQLQLYRRHQGLHPDQYHDQDQHSEQDQLQEEHQEEPLTARTANEQTMEALSVLMRRNTENADSDSDDSGAACKGVAGGDARRQERDMLFRRIEQEAQQTRLRDDDSLRLVEEKASVDCSELESGMSELEAQLRGFGSELDYLLLSDEERAAGKK